MNHDEKHQKAYQIRTLMNNITGMIDVTLQSSLDQEQRDYLGIALKSAYSVTRLVDEILTPERSQSSVYNYSEYSGPSGESTDHLLPQSLQLEEKSLAILVAEDNPINQKIVQKYLTRRGHKVTVAKNGKEALDAFANKPFDVILMDIRMPEMDGREATQLIRDKERSTGKHIPIVAISADEIEGETELSHLVDAYIPKPFSAARLFKVIADVQASKAQNSK